MPDRTLTRRTFTKNVAAGAAAVAFGAPAFIPHRGEAADVLKIGQIEELTGVYASVAQSEVNGAAIAADWWNDKGGVMGRKVQVLVEDNQNDPGVSVEKARKLVNENKAVALMGTLNSAASISTSGAAASLGVMFVVSGGHADQITGSNCHWTTFQTCHPTWALTHATGFSIAKQFGKKWYIITPDYAFGHALLAGYQDVIKQVGGEIVESDLTPLGTTDFSPYLTKVEAAKPSCLLVLPQGSDWVNCLKQASQYGISAKIPIAGPFAEMESILAIPPADRVGYWGAEWYYKGAEVLGADNALAAKFVAEYRKRHHAPPTARSAFGYVAMDRLLWAINEAKSTDALKCVKTLAGAPFNTIWKGQNQYRPVDHALEWPMWFGKLNPNGTPGDPNDVFNIQDSQPAKQIYLGEGAAAKACNLKFPA